ncbi:MAG TPA: YggS family pyridoxal phosphate-dependent enzyme [Bacillota bacterium]|nr:YggS family pyridoxal phosphate-dependent enzyme [Bacillota bacterium]
MNTIELAYEQVKRRIDEACERSNRNPDEVQMVAVTKYSTLETTKAALDAGLLHLGESKVQDAVPKWEQLGERGIWHFIGHLQTNKVKNIIGRFPYVHSLDRESLALELQKWGKKENVVTKCFVQVNVSGESSKFGIDSKEVLEFVKKTSKMSNIEIFGLMTMAPFVVDPEEARPVFRRLKELQLEVQNLNLPNVSALHLSMGMSNDFDVAVEEGATFIRLGSVLVGQELK